MFLYIPATAPESHAILRMRESGIPSIADVFSTAFRSSIPSVDTKNCRLFAGAMPRGAILPFADWDGIRVNVSGESPCKRYRE